MFLAAVVITPALSMYVSCTFEPDIKTGDIVFVGIPSDKDSTVLDYIHTSVIEIDDDGTWIIDATNKRGVARYPMDEFIADFRRHDGSFPTFEVLRLIDTTGVTSFVENAKAFIGEPYDLSFAPDNGCHYCTELVHDSFVADGKSLFPECPMDFTYPDGEFPSFWLRTFKRLGAEIPQGRIGTTPGAMRKDAQLMKVGELSTP